MSAARKAPPKGGQPADAAAPVGEPVESRGYAPPPAPEVEPSELRGVGFVRKGMHDMASMVREATRWRTLAQTPYGVLPAAVFGLTSLVGGFDASIFRLVLPNIVQDLNINAIGILQVFNLTSFVFIFLHVFGGHFLDRWRRLPFVAGGTVVEGVTSVLTPHARGVYALGVYQGIADSSDVFQSVPNLSLISDYYPPEARGKAFAMAGTLRRAAAVFSPYLIGLIAIRYGWRTPMYISGPALIVAGVIMFLVLREPVRGYMERRSAGLSEAEAQTPEPPVSFGEAWRTVWGIRTLRQLFIGDIVVGVGDRIYGFILPFLLAETYHLDVFDRGKVFSVSGVGIVVGAFLGGGIVDTLMARRPQRVLIFAGIIVSLGFFELAGLSLKPPAWVMILLLFFFGFSLSLIGPARRVFHAQILPAHVRSFGLNVTVLADIPGVILFGLFLGRIPTWGFRGVLFAGAPFLLVGGIIYMAAAGFFDRDRRSAIASQIATFEYKRAKEAGTVKLLVCRDIDVDYDGVQVLFGVDFEAEEGEIVALLGTNGAGKSTLLKAISGVHEASGGAVLYDGRDTTHVPPYEIASRGIAHMPGGRGIFPGLTVRENIELAAWTHKDEDDDYPYERGPLKDVDMDEVLEIFPALKGLMNRPAGALSGGEQQMVSLAQAFLQRPRLLLIDELSLGLSPVIVQQLLESVKAINKRGVTIVVVEQSVNVALTLAERAIFMEKGEVKFAGLTKDLLARPDILRAVYVKGTGALTSQPGSTPKPTRRAIEDRRVVLSVEGLKKSFGGVTAVDGVSFDLHDEEILGLIGPNGAGKTTIFDLISGFQLPDEGRVVYEGNDVTKLPPDQRARMQLVRRFQDAKLFPSLTVYETLLIALDRRQDVKNMALIAMQLPQVRQSERRVRRRADQLIELLGIEAFRDKFVKELSTGLRRVTDLACVLATEPRALLLDEPSSGIAQAEAESLGPLLQRVRRETGCSILIIEHDMPLISRVADELIALDQGRVVMRDVPDVVLNDPRVIESYLGTSEAAIRRSGVRT
jgi:ABC-type branched-subunit amino acid transport system ATPase component/MFS family permease